MTEPQAAAFEAHPRFERTADGVFAIEALDFEGWVRLDEGAVVLVEEVPTLDATVEGETVAPVVEDGWFETFERRVADVTGVVEAVVADPVVHREGDVIRVETRIPAENDGLPDVAIAAANYIEGTWVEGIIPGYEYDERVRSIRSRARHHAKDGS